MNNRFMVAWRAQPAWFWLTVLAALLPVVASLLIGVRAQFYPIHDDAYDAMAVIDIMRGHLPLLGSYSSSSEDSGVFMHHPGPLYWYALAPFTAAFGGSPLGLMVAQATIGAVCVLGTVHLARHIGGRVCAITIALAFSLTIFTVGPELLYRPYIPYGSLLPIALAFISGWGVAVGRLRFLPWFVAATALASQAHSSGLVTSAAWGVAVFALWAWNRWGPRPSRRWPKDGGATRPLFISLALATLLWLPVVIEWFVNSPNNFTQMWAYLGAPKTEGVGLGLVLKGLAMMLSPWPPTHVKVTQLAQGGLSGELTKHVGWGTQLLAIAVVGAAVVLVGCRWRANPRSARVWGTGVFLILVGLSAQAVAMAGLSVHALTFPWEFLQLWPMVHLLWGLVVTLGIMHFRQGVGLHRQSLARLAATIAVTSLILTFLSPVRRSYPVGAQIANNAPALFHAIDSVSGTAPRQTHVLVEGDTMRTQWGYSWTLAYALLREGYTPHMVNFGPLTEDWDYRRHTTTPPEAVRVVSLEADSDSGRGVLPGMRPTLVLPDPGGGTPAKIYVLPPRGR